MNTPIEFRGFGATAVYIHWDADGAPLYVGMTTGIKSRGQIHSGASPWWSEVADIEVVFDGLTHDEASAVELALIYALQPPHNIEGTSRDRRPRQLRRYAVMHSIGIDPQRQLSSA